MPTDEGLMETDVPLIPRATGRTWVRWRRTSTLGKPRRLYVHLCPEGSLKALCGRMMATRRVEDEQLRRLCPHCRRLSR